AARTATGARCLAAGARSRTRTEKTRRRAHRAFAPGDRMPLLFPVADADAGPLSRAMAGSGAGPVRRVQLRTGTGPGARRSRHGDYLRSGRARRRRVSAVVTLRAGAGGQQYVRAGQCEAGAAGTTCRPGADYLSGGATKAGYLYAFS